VAVTLDVSAATTLLQGFVPLSSSALPKLVELQHVPVLHNRQVEAADDWLVL